MFASQERAEDRKTLPRGLAPVRGFHKLNIQIGHRGDTFCTPVKCVSVTVCVCVWARCAPPSHVARGRRGRVGELDRGHTYAPKFPGSPRRDFTLRLSRGRAVWVVVYIPRNISVNFTDKMYDKTTEHIRSYLISTRNRSQNFPTLRARTRTLQMVQKGPFWGGH